jgi:hypothetical protein
VFGGVNLPRLFSVVRCIEMMPVRDVRVMAGGLVFAGFKVLRSSAMLFCSALVMFGCLLMVLCSLMSCRHADSFRYPAGAQRIGPANLLVPGAR